MTLQKAFLNAFTISILSSIKTNNRILPKRDVINSDLIPSISEDHFKENHLIEKKIIPLHISQPTQKPIQSAQLMQPIQTKRPIQPIQRPIPQRVVPAPANTPASTGEYGKITNLIRDPTITLIECNGAGETISIIRAGQKQFTKISLNPVEIKEILDTVSQKARIPILEGIFKAAVDNFIVNAVVSSIVGSRFVIKKQTPYSLLEQ